MKPPEFDPNSDRNWAWPEKTWFRERLNALRAGHEPASLPPTGTIAAMEVNLVATQNKKV
jgi:hypothetical protein